MRYNDPPLIFNPFLYEIYTFSPPLRSCSFDCCLSGSGREPGGLIFDCPSRGSGARSRQRNDWFSLKDHYCTS